MVMGVKSNVGSVRWLGVYQYPLTSQDEVINKPGGQTTSTLPLKLLS